MKLPQSFETYLHQNGLAYTVLCLALDQDKQEINVIHQGADGRIWSRPIGNFVGLHRNGHPRFQLHQSTDAQE